MINYDMINEIYDITCVDVRCILDDLGLVKGDTINAGTLMDKYRMGFTEAYHVLCVMTQCGVIAAPNIYKMEQFHTVTANPVKTKAAITHVELTQVTAAFTTRDKVTI